MLFEQRFWGPIASGEVTVTFRRGKRRQVVPGRRCRTPGGMIEVDALADALGRERPAFKTGVREPKELGLTLSLEVGYRLSPRGAAFLRARG